MIPIDWTPEKKCLVKSDTFKKNIWKKAGEWYAKKKKYIAAEEFFYKAKEFDLLLITIESDRGRSLAIEYKEKVIKYLTDCPSDVRGRHHLAMLTYILFLFTFNESKLFQEMCSEVNINILKDPNLASEKERIFLLNMS